MVLAVRRPDDVDATELRRRGITVDNVCFEATETGAHAALDDRLRASRGPNRSVLVGVVAVTTSPSRGPAAPQPPR